MDNPRVMAEDGRLTEQLAADLDPPLRDALDKRLRREILRALEAGGGIGGVQDLSSALSGATMSAISYHLKVLERAGAVSDGTAFAPSEGRRLYRSEVAGDERVRIVLRATERWDRRQPEPGPTGALAMFRLPRPGPTLRLRRRQEEQPGAGR